MKPGYQTTEFWITLVASVVPVLVALGIFSPEEGQTVMEQWTGLVAQGGAFIVAAVVAWKYISSRTFLKSLETVAEE